jgi:hypothetical protein
MERAVILGLPLFVSLGMVLAISIFKNKIKLTLSDPEFVPMFGSMFYTRKV